MSRSVEFNSWCIVTGEDFRSKFFVKDPTLDKIENPNYDDTLPESVNNPKQLYQPKDLTGYTAKMDIRTEQDSSATPVAELETGSGITIGSPDPADGSVEIFIDSTVTKASPISDQKGEKVYYDIFLIPSSGDNIRLFYGQIKIVGSVTDV